MDIVEKKLQEIKDYFIDKVVKGGFSIRTINHIKRSELNRVTLVIDEKYTTDTLVNEDTEILQICSVYKENRAISDIQYFPVISEFKMTEDQQKKAYSEYCNKL